MCDLTGVGLFLVHHCPNNRVSLIPLVMQLLMRLPFQLFGFGRPSDERSLDACSVR